MFYTNCILLKTNELGRTEQKEYIKEIKKRKIVKNINDEINSSYFTTILIKE